jgi:hypothetical protein
MITAMTASAAELASAKITEVTGSVTKYASNGQQTRLAPGAILKEGDSITTAPLSGAKLVFSNGSEMTVEENTSVNISKLQQEAFSGNNSYQQLEADPSKSQTLLELNYGKLSGHVKQLRPDSMFHVQTPLGTAAIRGTRWSALLIYNAARGQFTLTVKNFDGLVDILSRYTGNVAYSVNKVARKGYDSSTGETTIEQLPQDHTISLTIDRGDPGFNQLFDLIKNIAPTGPRPVITPAPPTGPGGNEDNDDNNLGIIIVSPEGQSQPNQ